MSPVPSFKDITYTGAGSGSATLTAGGAFTISGLAAGTYSVVVSNAGCGNVTVPVTITAPSQLVASSSAGTIACFGGSTTVTVSATGGTGSYSGTGTFTVSAGAYSYTVTDANGCTATTTGTVTQPTVLSASSSAGTIACNGGTTTVTVSGSGGTAPYSGTGTFTVSAGNYSYTVTDARGCTATTTGTVSQPTVLSASSSAGTIACNGGTTTVTVSGSGGTAPYSGTGTFTVSAGNYSYTVTDARGCTATTTGTVSQPTVLSASSSAGTIACFGGTTTVTVSATGGTAPYSGTGSFTVNAGAYSYTVTDANGCTSVTSGTVTQPAQLTTSTTITSCSGYLWSVSGLTYSTTGVYTFNTLNGSGCTVINTLNLTITGTTSNTTTASACSTYHWGVNDVDYTVSGTYTDVRDCHTEILVLTITGNTTNTTTASACGSYTWSNNGQTYNASGTYTGTTTGCVTQVLNLTITTFAITTQPVATNICSTVGSTATLTVAANATASGYTWQYRVPTATNPNPTWISITANSAAYSDVNTAALTITKTSALPVKGTQYRVLVSGDCGSAESNAVVVTILSTIKAGSILVPSTNVCLGSDLTFTLSNYAATSFQWQSSPFSSGTAPGVFTDIVGATGTTYTLTNAQLNSNRSYRVVAYNACNNTTATTATKTITVNPASVAGTITVGGGTICEGGSGSLKIAGYVGKIQWEYSTDGTTYVNAPKAADAQVSPFSTTSTSSTATSYVPTNMTVDLYFRAKVTSGACSSVYTAPVQYVIGTVAVAGTVSGGTTLCPATGTTLTLSNATGTITWEKSTNYATATPTWTATTNHSLVYPTGNLTLSTAYRAKVTIGTCSTVYSNLAYVLVVAKPVAKTVLPNTTTPTGKTALTAICVDSDIKVLTIGAGYVGSIQWQTSTTSATTGFSDIAGATGVSYTVTDPVVGVNYFRAVFSNTCGVVVNGIAVAVYYQDCTPAKVSTALPFAVVAYPNPYSDTFHLNLTTSSEERVGVSIYDMTGKLLDKREVGAVEASELSIGDRFASGVYNVVVTQGSEVKTLRVVKR
jgi:hypothetical protein